MSYVRPYPSCADVILCSRSHLSLDRYWIPHALLICPTSIRSCPRSGQPIIPAHIITLLAFKRTHLLRPSEMFLVLHPPHSQSALCIHSSQTSDRRTRPHSQAHPRTASYTLHCSSLSPSSLRIAFTRSLLCSLMLVHLYHPPSFVALALVSSHFARSYYDPI